MGSCYERLNIRHGGNQDIGPGKVLGLFVTFTQTFPYMQLPEATTLVNRLIASGERHQDYERTIELAETYRIYITGQGIAKKLIQFNRREDAGLFAQRLAITKSITPAVASSIRQPFNKVTRNDRVRKSLKIENEGRKQVVEEMAKTFYGSAIKKSRGLDYWMKTRFVELQFIDPNSWIVVEWSTPTSGSQVVRPRPFEVSSREAVNFHSVNDEVKWLFVKQDITIRTKEVPAPAGTQAPARERLPGVVEPAGQSFVAKSGVLYTLYDEDVTVSMEQVDTEYLTSIGYVYAKNEALVKIGDTYYIMRDFTPNIGYPPVFRVGYKRDEATNARTFVNPWHDALCYFDKTLKTVSELDLTMTLHTFPQKLQYVDKCPGPPDRSKGKCNLGLMKDGSPCSVCKGSGYKFHTSAQDAIILPMPETKEELIDLDALLVYKAPPIELIKFQNEYCQQLERQAHQAVYNSQVFVKKAGSPGATGQPIQTATEADFNMQSVYDALEPFTEKFSEVWRGFMITFAILAGEPFGQVDAVHEFPADYKLKSGEALLADRKAATESGAPGFMLDTIDDDLATIIYAGDDVSLSKFRTKKKFSPFSGSTPDEITERLTSQNVPQEPKVLHENFNMIFNQIEEENPEFWTIKDPAKQKELVDKKVAEYMQRLQEQKPVIDINSFRNAAPGGDGGTGAGDGGNPGPGTGTNAAADENNKAQGGAGNNATG